MRILITGSRTWQGEDSIRAVLEDYQDLEDVTLLHGGAAGPDEIAGRIAAEFGWKVEVWPADWNTHGRSAGIRRNLAMLDSNPDEVIAFWDGVSRGTWHCIEQAKRRRLTLTVLGSRPQAPTLANVH
jgi:hypothetical protein